MSNIKEIDFKINKDLKEGDEYIVSCPGEDLMLRAKYNEGKNFKADDFADDLGVLSCYGLPFYRVDNKSKLKKDHYFVSDDGHYTFSRHNDGETINIRYIEKEEEEKPRYIFGVGELKFSNEDYNKRLNTLFKEDKEEKEKTLKMGECPNFSKIVDDIINEYLENHGKYLSVPIAELNITTPDPESFKNTLNKIKERIDEVEKEKDEDLSITKTEFNITTPDAESLKKKLEKIAKEKDEDLMIYNLGYNKRLIYSFKNDKLTCETPKKELYDRLLKFNGTSYDKLFDEEVVKIYFNRKIYRGISKDNINYTIELIDDFEDYIKFTDFGYWKIIRFTDYLFWKL